MADGPPKILLVDDSELIRQKGKDVLEDAGYTVQTAEDIWVAGQVVRFQPDLVLMDVTVSTQNGASATAALKRRRLTGDKQVRILLYSVKPAAELAELAAECGADGYIVKSEDDQLFLDQVQAALDGRPVPAPGKSA